MGWVSKCEDRESGGEMNRESNEKGGRLGVEGGMWEERGD